MDYILSKSGHTFPRYLHIILKIVLVLKRTQDSKGTMHPCIIFFFYILDQHIKHHI